RAAQDPDDDLGRRTGRRFYAFGQSRQLSRASPALGDRGDRDPLAGGADRHRHRPRRHALLSPRRHHRRRRGTRRRHDRELGGIVRGARPGRATVAAPAQTGRLMKLTRRWLAAGVLLGALILVGSFSLAEALRTSAAVTRVAIEATSIEAFDNRDPTRIRFGALEFRGGLVLTSNDRAFGGISSLHMEPDGAHFIAITDQGSWLRGRIVYRDGKPVGVADAEMAPMLAWDDKPLASHRWYDVESLVELDGQFYAGIERVEKIVRFDFRRFGFAARGEPIKVPAEFESFSYNQSLECLAAGPPGSPLAGELIVVTERSLDAAGNHRSFLLKGEEVGRFTVKPGAVADGAVLIEADLGFQIDNMEGIAVHRNDAGEIVLTLVSDDNFSP